MKRKQNKNQKFKTLGRRSFLTRPAPAPGYTFRLTQAFVSAVDAAEADADAQQQPNANGRLRANVAPAPRAGAGQPGPP